MRPGIMKEGFMEEVDWKVGTLDRPREGDGHLRVGEIVNP